MKLLTKYKNDIREFADNNNHTYARLGKNGLVPMHSDRITASALSASNDNNKKSRSKRRPGGPG